MLFSEVFVDQSFF